MDIIGIFVSAVTIFASYLGWKTYRNTYVKKPYPEEERQNLLATFKMNQKLSIDLQDIILKIINNGNLGNNLFIEGMTFSQYLNFVISNHKDFLNDDIYENIKNDSIYSVHNIHTMQKSLNDQNTNLINSISMIKAKFSHLI